MQLVPAAKESSSLHWRSGRLLAGRRRSGLALVTAKGGQGVSSLPLFGSMETGHPWWIDVTPDHCGHFLSLAFSSFPVHPVHSPGPDREQACHHAIVRERTRERFLSGRGADPEPGFPPPPRYAPHRSTPTGRPRRLKPPSRDKKNALFVRHVCQLLTEADDRRGARTSTNMVPPRGAKTNIPPRMSFANPVSHALPGGEGGPNARPRAWKWKSTWQGSCI